MLKKIIVLAVIFAALSFTVNVEASDVTPIEVISPTPTAMPNPYSKLIVRSDGSINLNNVYDSYFNLLTNDQQDLCNYLIGLSNYMYLTARGFTYETVSTGEQLISMLCSFGYRFWQIVPDAFSSRLTPYMQNYVAACVTFSAQQDDINGNLGAWIDAHSEDLYIPYSDNALAGWTAFYNDPTNLGVANWGSYESPWVSGQFFDFAYSEYPFESNFYLNQYNNYILNNSPVIYSPNVLAGSGNHVQQVISFLGYTPFNSLYVLRGNSFRYYRFGYDNGLSNTLNCRRLTVSLRNSNNKVFVEGEAQLRMNGNVIDSGANRSIQDIVNYAFVNTPFNLDISTSFLQNCYPYIEHVYLVDDLNTLANKEEIYDDFSFQINSDNAKWIDTPKGQVLYYPIGSGANLVEFPLPEYLKKDDGTGNLISIDPSLDLDKSIVNNTVINNYDIVAPGVQINVPVDWFENDGNYLEYTYDYGLPFFVFVGDVFNSLGEIRVIILGVLIFGLVSGIIVKFLQ